MQQDREPRNKLRYLQSIILATKETRVYNGEKTVSSIVEVKTDKKGIKR